MGEMEEERPRVKGEIRTDSRVGARRVPRRLAFPETPGEECGFDGSLAAFCEQDLSFGSSGLQR